MALHIHFLRHEEVASHRGDIPLTPRGQQRAVALAQRFRDMLEPGERVMLLHTPTRRTYETALAIYTAMADTLARDTENERPNFQLLPPTIHHAIRNPDIYVAGERVEMVSSVEALAEQFPTGYVRREDLEQLSFWRAFWSHPDRIGYWVHHPNPRGENSSAVARRLLTFAVSLLDLPRTQPRRYICVTHSPLMRAFIKEYIYTSDAGEPDYGESIDLHFTLNGALTMQYRDTSRTVGVQSLPGQ